MTEATVTCGMWRGITTPAGWSPPWSDAMPGMFVKLWTKEGKEATKYAAACAMACELSADGLTRDGKVIKEGDLFLVMAEAHKEAIEAKEAAKVAAEKAAIEAKARALRMDKLATDIKEAQEAHARAWHVRRGEKLPPEAASLPCEAITFEMMEAWADIAHESGAYLVMHGGPDNGAGISIRFKQEAKVATPRAASTGGTTGGGKKGGTETRASAYACALQAQKVAGCPHDIKRTGTGEDGDPYVYYDHGTVISGALSKYLKATYPGQGGAAILDGYEERRKQAKAS